MTEQFDLDALEKALTKKEGKRKTQVTAKPVTKKKGEETPKDPLSVSPVGTDSA